MEMIARVIIPGEVAARAVCCLKCWNCLRHTVASEDQNFAQSGAFAQHEKCINALFPGKGDTILLTQHKQRRYPGIHQCANAGGTVIQVFSGAALRRHRTQRFFSRLYCRCDRLDY